MYNTQILRKYVSFKKNIKKHSLLFHYNIRSDTMLGIEYVACRQITCSCSSCLSKLSSPCNIRQEKFNKVRYKVDNEQCVYLPILGFYKN